VIWLAIPTKPIKMAVPCANAKMVAQKPDPAANVLKRQAVEFAKLQEVSSAVLLAMKPSRPVPEETSRSVSTE